MLAKRRSGKTIPQLGQQKKQSCPPLKVSSDIVVANDSGLLPGTNPGDYVNDSVIFEIAKVTNEETYKYVPGKPLIKPGHPPLTPRMHELHEWYMNIFREKTSVYMRVKKDHEFIGAAVLLVEFQELFQ